jgi:GT2 family glycosyltransferase
MDFPEIPHVITVTHSDRLDFLRRTIPALLRTRWPMTLTLVANRPSDRMRYYLSLIESFLWRLIINDENLGKAGGGNIGWRLRDADHTIFIDDDMLALRPDWLAHLIDIADNCPSVGVVGHSVEPREWPIDRIEGRAVQRNRGGLVGGACMLIPRRAYEKCGRYDEELIPYSEDDALYCWKVRLAGLECVYADHTERGRAFRHLENGDDRAYRAWKDEQRARAIPIRDQLYQQYRAGDRPLNFSQ